MEWVLYLQMIKVIRHVLLEKGWWHLPRYAYGTSSGGCIALELALRFPLQVGVFPTCHVIDLSADAQHRTGSPVM